MSPISNIAAFKNVFLRECKRVISRPLYFFGMVIVPLSCYVFFTSLMWSGLPVNIPIGVVDIDNTKVSRHILRNLDAMEHVEIIENYQTVTEAVKAIQSGKIYGFYYIPNNLSKEVKSRRLSKVSFYTNDIFLVPGSLIFKDMKELTELSSAAVNKEIMRAKGYSDKKILATLQPIALDIHKLNNPRLNYSIYLNNIILPGILSLMIFLMTVYSIGVEIKEDTARKWLRLGNKSVVLSLAGKLLLQTLVFFLMGIVYNIYLYEFLDFPVNSGMLPMLLATFLFVLASQACGIFIITLVPTLRMGLSAASLWGIISFSISGFSFPAMGMFTAIRAISNLFPLRHYYLIYVSQALNGYSMLYAWKYYICLMLFMLLPFIFGLRLKKVLIYYKYLP